MIDELLRNVLAAVRSYGYEDAYVKRFDVFTGREAVCIRPVQPSVLNVYMDGTRTVRQTYQVIVRRRSEEEAMRACCDIAERLEAERLDSATGRYRFAGGAVAGDPAELELDEANMYAWACTMAAIIDTE